MPDSISLPKISSNAWRTLRARASSAPSSKFTPAAVAATLAMASPRSAADNVVYPMRRLGLIDDDGALTARGNKWRVDSTYAEACDEIIAEVYPDELSGLLTDEGTPDRGAVVTWLQHKGLGESNAKQMASTYAMIASRVPPEAQVAAAGANSNGQSARGTRSQRSNKAKNRAPEAPAAEEAKGGENSAALPSPPGSSAQGPQIHLDIQIHIPATADAEQIDAIFASMAKHLYP